MGGNEDSKRKTERRTVVKKRGDSKEERAEQRRKSNERGKEKQRERENQRGTTEGERKKGRESHQHCPRHHQLIIFFFQQPLPFSITTASTAERQEHR